MKIGSLQETTGKTVRGWSVVVRRVVVAVHFSRCDLSIVVAPREDSGVHEFLGAAVVARGKEGVLCVCLMPVAGLKWTVA